MTRSSKSASRSGNTARRLTRTALLAGLYLVSACSSGPDGPATSAPTTVALTRENLPRLAADFELCQAVLYRQGAAFHVLDDTPIENGCGITDAVRLNASTVAWNRNFPLTCAAAAALLIWERDVLQPAAQRKFSVSVSRLEHLGSYACRNRNNAAGGRRSEHARANAIDIGGFTLADGEVISVENDWHAGGNRSAFLREIHRGACDIFKVTIGPDGDANHYNHFHFDMGQWQSCS